jgi:hypothetical protein
LRPAGELVTTPEPVPAGTIVSRYSSSTIEPTAWESPRRTFELGDDRSKENISSPSAIESSVTGTSMVVEVSWAGIVAVPLVAT